MLTVLPFLAVALLGAAVGWVMCQATAGRSWRQLNARVGAACARAQDEAAHLRARYSPVSGRRS